MKLQKELLGRLNFRSMVKDDIEDVLNIERSSFSTPWSRSAFLDALNLGATRNFVIELDGAIIGYIIIYAISFEAHIANFAIHPFFRRKGIGEFLLMKTIDELKKEHIKEFYLEVREGNIAAINLYKKIGFEVIGKRKGYYRDTGEDALIMALFK